MEDSFAEKSQALAQSIARTVVAREEVIQRCVICLLAGGISS